MMKMQLRELQTLEMLEDMRVKVAVEAKVEDRAKETKEEEEVQAAEEEHQGELEEEVDPVAEEVHLEDNLLIRVDLPMLVLQDPLVQEVELQALGEVQGVEEAVLLPKEGVAHQVDSLPIRMHLGEEVPLVQPEEGHLDQEDLQVIDREVLAIHLVEDHQDPEEPHLEAEEEELLKHHLDHRQDMVHLEALKGGLEVGLRV